MPDVMGAMGCLLQIVNRYTISATRYVQVNDRDWAGRELSRDLCSHGDGREVLQVGPQHIFELTRHGM